MLVGSLARRVQLALLASGVLLAAPLAGQRLEGVTFRNDRTVAVTVEIRLDGGAGCDTARPIATETIQPGARWELNTAAPICWRRHANPELRDGVWAGWHQHAAKAAAEAVTL